MAALLPPRRPGALPAANLMGSSLSDRALIDALAVPEGSSADAPPSSVTLAIEALRRRDLDSAGRLCLEALNADERNGVAWHVLAITHEGKRDFATALSCYEAALTLIPGHPRVLLNLSRLALTLDMNPVAEKLIRLLLGSDPENAEGLNNLAIALSRQGQTEAAIEVLRSFLARQPGHPNLLNTLGGIVADMGDLETANLLFSEALAMAPGQATALFNLGANLLVMGFNAEGLERIEAALKVGPTPENLPAMVFSRGLAKLALGDLAEGWRDYEARNEPTWPGYVANLREEAPWRPGETLAGRRLLVFGEQGLGDEVLFAGLIPDLVDAVGPDGAVIFAVEPRLTTLVSRSFPEVRVLPHRVMETGGHTVRIVPGLPGGDCDLWAPLASLLQVFRPNVGSFTGRGSFLKADTERILHWRRVMSDAPRGPRVGLLWKSAVQAGGRGRFFSDFGSWAPVLQTPGVTLVNLQYGDCTAELSEARERFGVEIWQPRGIDLKQDLDDVAALASALDLTIGFSNASFNLAAATGAPAWLVAAKGAWTTLGTAAYPWYPQVRVYQPAVYAEWSPTFQKVALDLARFRDGRC